MSVALDTHALARGKAWRWWVCCLLLMATMINYMDRLTLNLLSQNISAEFGLSNTGYGWLESGFGLAFAVGCIVFGLIVDRWNVFWVYPIALLAWSAAGFLTGFATGFASLLLFRVLLGFAEAANWPCALRTTQRILPPSERPMGNSILQSGAAIGAILIPLVLLVLFSETREKTWQLGFTTITIPPKTWQLPFMVVGAVGTLWVILWWSSLRPADLALQKDSTTDVSRANPGPKLPPAVFARRFFVLIVLVVSINMTWHYLRAWLPKYLSNVHQFTQDQTNWFSIAYYICTDIGALTAGFVALRLARSGMKVHTSRRLVFLGGSLLTTLCLLIPFIATTWIVIALLMLVGLGALAVFPCYYSFSQDLTTRHQGKVTGILGASCWIAVSIWQPSIGATVDLTGSFTIPFIIAGLLPMLGWVVLTLFWGEVEESRPVELPTAGPVVIAVVAGTDERITADRQAVQSAGG